MKELSIEQKAKRYDKALEKSKRLYEQGTITESLAYIFPELKKSEDEKIRKTLIDYFNTCHGDYYGELKRKDILAWLEKQGQTFTKKDVDDAYLKGVCDAKQEIEKQGEQKPANKVEPKFKVKYADSEYNVLEVKDIAGVTFYGIEDEPNHIDYVKADNCEIISGYGIKEIGLSFPTKPVMFSEQKPAWSEEVQEEQVNEEFINALGTMLNGGLPDRYLVSEERIKKSAELLFSIVRKQLKNEMQEWSEEDELKRTTLIDVVKKQRGSAIFEGLLPEELTDWLESLRPQNRWKPTKEQLYWLKQVIPNNSTSVSNEMEVLSELYRQLKALKEL